MTNKEAAGTAGFTVLCAGEERTIRSFYCCDLAFDYYIYKA